MRLPDSTQILRAGLVLVALTLVAAMAWAMLHVGPWYDEFFTLAVTGPASGFGESLRSQWLADNHPPLFYVLSWLTNGLGDEAGPRRFVNFLFLLVCGGGLVWLARLRPGAGALLTLMSLGLASTLPAIDKAAELRSNYLAMVGATLAVAAICIVARPGERISRAGWITLTLCLTLAFNVHFTATVLTGSVTLAWVVRLLVAGDRRMAMALVAAAAVASLPFLITTGIQLQTIEANTRSFWIPAGFTWARWAAQAVFQSILLANPPLLLSGLVGLAIMGQQSRRERAIDPDLVQALTVAIGCGAGVALLLVVHLWRPIVIERYLIVTYPMGMLVLATGAERLLRALPRGWSALTSAAIVLAALAAITLNLSHTLERKSWFGTGQVIARIVRDCPDTAVHADLFWNSDPYFTPPADNRRAVPLGYASVARHFGFRLEPQSSRRLSTRCTTLFWNEHVTYRGQDDRQIVAQLRRDGYPVSRARLFVTGSGWIIVAR